MITLPWRRIVVLASGPSLTLEQTRRVGRARLEGWRAIAVNDTWRLLPSADVLYACDGKWWEMHYAAVRAGFAGELWTQARAGAARDRLKLERFELEHVEGRNGRGLCTAPGAINTGGNSGFQAINLAYHFGAREIVLVGFDMQNTGGRAHFFGDHPDGLPQAADPGQWISNYDDLAPDLAREGIVVYNATAETALRCFPRVPLERALSIAEAA